MAAGRNLSLQPPALPVQQGWVGLLWQGRAIGPMYEWRLAIGNRREQVPRDHVNRTGCRQWLIPSLLGTKIMANLMSAQELKNWAAWTFQ